MTNPVIDNVEMMPSQQRFAQALSRGLSIRNAAAAAEISEGLARIWATSPELLKLVKKYRTERAGGGEG